MVALQNKKTVKALSILSVFLLLLIFNSISFKGEEYQEIITKTSELETLPKLYTNIEEIFIDSDEDFITLGCPGNGTESSPFLIDSYIVSPGLNETSIFYISNVTKHFIIQNCQTENVGGIILEGLNSATAILRYNQIMRINLYYPAIIRTCISIIDCSNVIVSNNTCDSNVNGIIISDSRNVTVVNNTILNGINQPSSDRRYCGLTVSDSHNCSIYNNHFEEGGIFLDVSKEEISSLTIQDNSILRWDGGKHISTKTSILALKNASDQIIDASIFGQIIIIKCENILLRNMRFNNSFVGFSAFFSNNCRIENGFSTFCQIGFLDYHSKNTEFYNITSLSNVRGVQLSSSEYCSIDELTATKCSSYEGLYIDENTKHAIVKNSNCSYNSLSTGIQDSGLNTSLVNNHMEHNYIGISLWSSENTTIIKNEINHNRNQGIYISGSANSLVYENTIAFNRNYGIYVTNSIQGTISTNLVYETEGYAIFLSSSTQYFLIYRNTFINNEPVIGLSQAFDSGFHNYWYQADVKIGNYWSGSSKKIYEIDGDANNQDLYPIKDPVIYPPDSFSWKTSFPNLLVFLIISILGFQTLRRKKKEQNFL